MTGSVLAVECRSLLDALNEAQAQLDSGKIPVLLPLESRVTALCLNISRAAPREAKALQPLLGRAIAQLDILAQGLKDKA
ncbi:MAG: hypothetical protein KDI13_04510 [Alphaproteobacteria bacterium]|nr:hypothetical protein [Alphaproteobacteria bacterium]